MKKLLLLLIINVACNNELNKENVNQEAILFNNNIKTLHYKYICDFQDTELFKSQIISNPKVLNYDECLEEINYCALNETNTLYLTADFLSNCLFNQNDKIDYVETKLIKESLKIVEFDNSYNEITVDNVNKLCYQPHPNIIFTIIKLCVSQKLFDSIDEINKLKLDGYCASDILLSMINILKEIQIDEDIKINFIKIISDTYIIVSDGIDSNIQLYSCLGKMINYIKNS